MSNKFDTDINLETNKSFNVNEFVSQEKQEARRTPIIMYVTEKEKAKFVKLAAEKYNGNNQNVFRALVFPELDKVL